MGVEPTADTYAAPATGFEDRGAHRDTTTPTSNRTRQRRSGQGGEGCGWRVRGCEIEKREPRNESRETNLLLKCQRPE